MTDLLQWHSCTCNSETEKDKRRNRKRWGNRKVWTKPSLSANSSVLFFISFLDYSWNVSHSRASTFVPAILRIDTQIRILVELEFEVLVFMEGGKPENPEKNPRSKKKQQTQPTYDAGPELNPSHIGGRRALSPLRHPCSLKQSFTRQKRVYWHKKVSEHEIVSNWRK